MTNSVTRTNYATIVQTGDVVEVTRYERNPAYNRKPLECVSSELSDYVATRVRSHLRRTGVRRTNNNRAALKRFKRLCRTRTGKNHDKPLFITFTFAVGLHELREAYHAFRLGMQRLRTAFGSEFAYIAVPQFHPGGHGVHFHCLFWGLPVAWGDVYENKKLVRQGLERKNRMIAKAWALGFVDCMQTTGGEGTVIYVSRYMCDDIVDSRYVGHKLYTKSRNFGDFVKFSTDIFDTIAHYLQLDDFVLDYQKEFSNCFLGQCVYSVYINT